MRNRAIGFFVVIKLYLSEFILSLGYIWCAVVLLVMFLSGGRYLLGFYASSNGPGDIGAMILHYMPQIFFLSLGMILGAMKAIQQSERKSRLRNLQRELGRWNLWDGVSHYVYEQNNNHPFHEMGFMKFALTAVFLLGKQKA